MRIFNKLGKALETALSLPKSFYVSWKLTSFRRAFSLPLTVRYNVKVLSVSGRFIGPGKMTIGFNRTGIYDVRFQRSMLNVSGTIEAMGPVSLGGGCRIDVAVGSTLLFAGKVSNSAGLTIVCGERIEIGNDTIISWNTLIIDTDFHYIKDIVSGRTGKMKKPVVIGANTWLCAGSMVLKGAVLPDGCVLSAGSVLTGRLREKNCLLRGNPAEFVRGNVTRSDIELNE